MLRKASTASTLPLLQVRTSSWRTPTWSLMRRSTCSRPSASMRSERGSSPSTVSASRPVRDQGHVQDTSLACPLRRSRARECGRRPLGNVDPKAIARLHRRIRAARRSNGGRRGARAACERSGITNTQASRHWRRRCGGDGGKAVEGRGGWRRRSHHGSSSTSRRAGQERQQPRPSCSSGCGYGRCVRCCPRRRHPRRCHRRLYRRRAEQTYADSAHR